MTLQPRDFNFDRETEYDLRFLRRVREASPAVQSWLYAEWVESARKRPTDLGTQPTEQMTKVWPALTWEESMSAMLLYVEDLRTKLGALDREHAPPKIIPAALAMGWIHRLIEEGKVEGIPPGSFYSNLFRDGVHPNAEGGYLVDLVFISSFTGKKTEALPLGTRLTPAQAKLMRDLTWDVVRNYPYSGFYKEGPKKVGKPQVRKLETNDQVTTVQLISKTPGAWFRYTLDGTEPSRTKGYVYCGIISLRPGMTLKAIAYKSGMADSSVMAGSELKP